MNSVTDMVSQRTNLDRRANLIVCRCASHVSLFRSSIVIRVLSVLRLLSAAAMPKRPETVASPTPRELSPRLPPLKISHAVEMPAPCESDAKILARTHAVHSEAEIRDNIMALQAHNTYNTYTPSWLDGTVEGRTNPTVRLAGRRTFTLR